MVTDRKPSNLRQLRESGWQSKPIKREIHDNFLRMLANGEELYPGIVGFDNTVIPEINLALIACHDMLFLGEKGQAKSRLMRSLVRFLDEEIPYIDIPASPFHDDPYSPISRVCKQFVEEHSDDDVVPVGNPLASGDRVAAQARAEGAKLYRQSPGRLAAGGSLRQIKRKKSAA